MYIDSDRAFRCRPCKSDARIWFASLVAWSVCQPSAPAQTDAADPARFSPVLVLCTIEKKNADFTAASKVGLTRNDFRGISQMLQGRATIVPLRASKNEVRRGDRQRLATLVGTTDEFAKMSPLKIAQGRFLSRADVVNRNNLAVLDSGTSKHLFPDGSPIGQAIRVDQQAFVVAGVFENTAANSGPTIYIPLTTMSSRFGDLDIRRASGAFEAFHYELSEIRIGLTDPMHLESVTKMVKKLLAASHESEDYSVEVSP